MNKPRVSIVPQLVVFLGSMAMMILELVASRLVSKFFGTSLYTWTGVIGICLGGISLGNFLGGRLADRYRPEVLIGWLLRLSALLVFLILVLDSLLQSLLADAASLLTGVMVLQSILVIFGLFFIPCAALGTFSPVMAKYALEKQAKVGRTVGSLYALSTIGSIIGTFLAGFVLIPLLDIRLIILIVALTLAGMALLFPSGRRVSLLVLAGIGLLFVLFQTLDPDGLIGVAGRRVLFSRYSQYSHIQVVDLLDEAGQPLERKLIMDGLTHNRHVSSRPDELLYEYERLFKALTLDNLARSGTSDFSALTLGGGAMTFPAWLQRHYRPQRNVVVEIDPLVVDLAYRYFEVPLDSGLEVAVADARAWVNSAARRATATTAGRGLFDVIYLDAFSSFSVPYHLTTREFSAKLASLLKPDGLLLANCIDIFNSGGFIGAYLATLDTVLPHTAIYCGPRFNRDLRSTYVIVAGRDDQIPPVLHGDAGEAVGYRLGLVERAQLGTANHGLVLTDWHAPVESLMAPVFLGSID